MGASVVYLVTKNAGKVREVEAVLNKYGFSVSPIEARKEELQSDLLEHVAKYAAEQLIGKIPEPFIVEDSGLFINILNGFPGPYSAYVYKTIGTWGILKLMEGAVDRGAKFVCAVALCLNGRVHVFRGEVEGEISIRARGDAGFGFDPIFVPFGYSKTFAEMSIEEKCMISHRAKALQLMVNYLIQVYGVKNV
ncbi:MAG: XTP/dITP diphosphatase [Thermofilaceae archaeon]|nr:XTP/dITP diphosphatase [Thermofilaceae archaeon]MCX8180824.1 XTP/dITP diphosphatase [Thermofilaceae archaeon]MDW8004610.1 XTP/dITP diphosphatase [Thermofilaceae archaeon]